MGASELNGTKGQSEGAVEPGAPRPPRGAFQWFDLLRLVAALVVVIEHARDLLWQDYTQAGAIGPFWKAIYFVTGFGHEAVMVFFILSGYWIAATVDRRRGAEDFWPDYLIDRLSRLMIVIVPALLLGLAYDYAGIHLLHGELYSGQSGAATIREPVASRLGLEVLLGNVVFLQKLAVPPFGSNGPLWSLANEFWYYLWYPALLVSVRRRRPSILLLSLVVGIIWPVLLPGFAVWLLGAGLYHLDRGGWLGMRVARPAGTIALVAGMAALGASLLQARFQLLPSAVSDGIVGASFALVAAGLLLRDPKLPRWLQPIARYGSGASFSLYVSHFPMLVVLATLLGTTGRLAPGPSALLVLLGLITAALIHGRIFAALIEGHTQQLRQWCRRRLLRN